MKMKFFSMLLLLTLCIAFSSCGIQDVSSEGSTDTTLSDIGSEGAVTDDNIESEEQEKYGRICLSSHQKELYDFIGENYGKDEIVFSEKEDYNDVKRALFFYNVDEIQCNSVFGSLYVDMPTYDIVLDEGWTSAHPEYTSYSYSTTLYGVYAGGMDPLPDDVPVTSMKAHYYDGVYEAEVGRQMVEEFREVEKRWLEELPGSEASEAERVYALTELMRREITYEEYEYGAMPYGIVHGKLFCEGYAYTFAYFADKLGIESVIAIGHSTQTQVAHGWNMVRIDDKWYHHDVTWYDGEGSSPSFKDFLRSEEGIISSGHTISGIEHFIPEHDLEEYSLPSSDEDYPLSAATFFDTSVTGRITEVEGAAWELKFEMGVPTVCEKQNEAGVSDGGVTMVFGVDTENRSVYELGYVYNHTTELTGDIYEHVKSMSSVYKDMLSGTTQSGKAWAAIISMSEYEENQYWSANVAVQVSDTEMIELRLTPNVGAEDPEGYLRRVIESIELTKIA